MSLTTIPTPSLKRPRSDEDSDGLDDTSSLLSRMRAFVSEAQASSPQSQLELTSIAMLEMSIKLLSHLSSSLAASSSSAPSALDMAVAIEEDKRERSVVIQYLPEGSDTLTGSQRVSCDADAIGKMCDLAGIEVGGLVHFRMGRRHSPSSSSAPASKGPRLLKLMFPGRSHQRDFLAKSREIRKDPSFAKIFIRPSLSKEQRNAEYKLRKEKRDRVSKGENVVIYDGKIMSRAEADALRSSRRYATGANAVRQGVSYAKAAASTPERMQTN